MGLDQYGRVVAAEHVKQDVDFELAEDVKAEEIAYWRKHSDLQGWMQKLYVKKGGKDPEFNCVPVVLTEDDLTALEVAIRKNLLPETRGFFFGASSRDDEERKYDLEFVAKARAAIADGKKVYYSSWW
jgi:hypothetical protein